MKFIHAADIHLGNPFIGLDQQLPDDLKTIVQQSTLTAFKNLIRDAIIQKVDFLVMPGDLYSTTVSSPKIQDIVSQQFDRLNAANIPVYLSFGNHDFQADKQQHLPWPPNVHVFNQKVETLYLTLKTGENVALTGFSYQTPRQTQKVITSYPLKTGLVDYHIGLYHGALGIDGDPYAPFALSDMLSKNYDYWALGHIHVRQTLNQTPFIGYSGDLQGLNRKEVGAKGYYLVESENHLLVPKFREAAEITWEQVTLEDVKNESDIISQIVNYNVDQMTFLSVEIIAHVDGATSQRIVGGITIEKIRAQLPKKLWVVSLRVRQNLSTMLAKDHIDQIYWQEAYEAIMSDFNIANELSNQAPLVVRDYFMSPEGETLLRDKMQQLIQARKV
ncbi:metallophosphoesterase family protein [Leuconostoc kimchii]|uniref:Phosphoesterase n=2 Tax=Leuconostoc kimchii TaxID=136609 RepID=D5T3Y7_LEUKI|nr:DNA repair exonuclease [Leuconostoc kimchii]ADG41389.1 phosphoesterase [Leuconostoc kimchii IMSNU 11154]QBR47744.1 DNA repair exonuclease [Leuconostoc kimchii]